MNNRLRMKVEVVGTFEQGISLKGENGKVYHWFTKSYSSPLFYAVTGDFFDISATTFIYDHPTPRTGLKNVRVLKQISK